MNIKGQHFRTIWPNPGETSIRIIDQRFLPHRFMINDLRSVNDVVNAIKDMQVRGAGLIGAAAGYGMWLAAIEAAATDSFHDCLELSGRLLKDSRHTGVNPEWWVKCQLLAIEDADTIEKKIEIAKQTATLIADEDAECCRKLGEHGVAVIEEIAKRKKG